LPWRMCRRGIKSLAAIHARRTNVYRSASQKRSATMALLSSYLVPLTPAD
jgi:hypothetical protein